DAGVEVGQIERREGDQAQPLWPVGDIEVAAVVAYVDGGAVGELALSLGKPALERRRADDRFVRVLQRTDGCGELVLVLKKRGVVLGPPADGLGPAHGIAEDQPDRTADATRPG